MSGSERISVLDAVRLLRTDIVGNLHVPPGVDDEHKFLLWWVFAGHREYPAAQLALTEAQRSYLFEPLTGWPVRGGLGMNRLLQFLFHNRPDLRRVFDLSSPVHVWDAISWLYVVGVRELGLDRYIDAGTLQALNSPVYPDEPQSLTWLMLFLLRTQASLRGVFDISSDKRRGTYAHWFRTKGVKQFGLGSLVDSGSIEVEPLPLRTVSVIGRAEPQFGVNLIGFAFGELGIGEDVRMAAQSCGAAGIPFRILNINPGQNLRQMDRQVEAHCTTDSRDLPYAINLFCLTGFDTLRVYAEQGGTLFDGRYNIGWWPWELPVWPKRWGGTFSIVDEVWAATRFTEDMFGAASRKPVTLMPLPVSIERMRSVSRQELGLPEHRFLFLFIFDFNSYLVRKNPHAVIEAFQRAFPTDDDGVGLVLKTMNSRSDDVEWQKFRALCERDPRITLLDRTLDRDVVLGLVDACDAYVSLHRSEGFGRTLAEAMLCGKPVVGTDFSGNADFLTERTGFPVHWSRRDLQANEYPFVEMSDGAWWADPDVGHAATRMQQARSAAGPAWSGRLKRQVRSRFSVKSVGTRMLNVLQARFSQLNS